MKNKLFTYYTIVSLLIIPITSKAQWAKSVGGSGYDKSYSIAVDGSGNTYITGTFEGTVDFDPGAGTTTLTSGGYGVIFFAKYDANGSLVWAKSVGENGNTTSYSITVDGSGNIYITGYFLGTVDFNPSPNPADTLYLTENTGGSIFFAKYNGSDGSLVWAKNLVATQYSFNEGRNITVKDGDLYLTGRFRYTTDFDPSPNLADTLYLNNSGGDAMFFAKYSSNDGSLVWAKSISGVVVANIDSKKIHVDGTGNVYVVGSFRGTADFDPSTNPADTLNLTSNGSESDIFFAKYNGNDGSLVWAKSIGGSNSDYGNDITIDGNSNIYITGTFKGTVDFDPGTGTADLISTNGDIFFAKYNNNDGSLFWAKNLKSSGTGYSEYPSIFVNNSIYVVGSFGGNVDFNPSPNPEDTLHLSSNNEDVFLANYSSNDGSLVWAKSMKSVGSGFTYNNSMVMVNNNIYITGYFTDKADFDPSTNPADTLYLTSNGNNDIFFAKYNSNGFLPVELTSFIATSKNNTVELSWSTVSEINNFGFEVEKAEYRNQNTENRKTEWRTIGNVQGNGTSNIQHHYTFIDNNVGTGKFIYRLKQIDMDGKFTYSEEEEVYVGVPKAIKLLQNYPNPFNPVTTINYEIPTTGKVYLKVYNVLGEEVATLVNGVQEAGRYSTQFDASKYSSGIYFYKLTSNNYTLVKSMLLVK